MGTTPDLFESLHKFENWSGTRLYVSGISALIGVRCHDDAKLTVEKSEEIPGVM